MIAFVPAAPEAVVVSQDVVFVELRITSAAPRALVVDRGTVDGLALGDRVTFAPRNAPVFEGRVVRVGERVAVVEPFDPAHTAPPGTRGEARVPSERFAKPAPPPAVEAPAEPPQAVGGEPEAPAPSVWTNTDEEWTPDQPLLARVRPFRPDERARRVDGRLYLSAEHWRGEDEHESTYARLGGGVRVENAFGNGGVVHADGELNWRDVAVPDEDGETKTRGRLDRLSYSSGGDRFTPSRFAVGRFLHAEFPELGVLDGVEWTRRVTPRHRFGGAVGFLPEPDAEQASGEDLELAAWYRWASDESERFTLGAAYQKTFHDLAADRDLVLAQLRWLPHDGWNAFATVWLDVYGASDGAKGSGVEPTQAYATLSRRFDGGTDVRITYSHFEFPEIEQKGLPTISDDLLADGRVDRATLDLAQELGRSFDVRLGGGLWSDEVDDGYDGEFGIDARDFVFDGAFVDLGAFAADGRFTTVFGWRARVGYDSGARRFALGYEFAQQDQEGFDPANDDLPQHRVRASLDWFGGSGWSFSGYGEAQIYDDETGVTAGLRLDRSF